MYKKMYITLFNAITDAINETDVNIIKDILKQAQIKSEEICINSDEEI
jgi:hypothetical protein